MSEFARDVPDEIIHALGGNAPTEQQWSAITAPLEPTVLIAGAGSGKTAVMAARIVWLILNEHAKPSEILGLTFTNKAADNLLQRVRRAIEPLGLPDGEEPVIATYHGFSASLITDYGLRAGLEPGASLMSEAQAWQLCSQLFNDRTFDVLEVRSNYHVASVRHLADECANHLVSPRDVMQEDAGFLAKIEEKGIKVAGAVRYAARKRIELANVVEDYQRVKRARQLLDYGDQIARAFEIAGDEAVQRDFRARFKVALLDEYQDTNHAQARLLRCLMPDGYPVMGVGDPDQNIYAWRGASLRNLLAFAGDFRKADGSDATVLPLVVNFRSGARILTLANTLIDQIPATRRPPDKVLEPYEGNGQGEVAAFLTTDQIAEAARIADEAIAVHDAGTPWREIAILPRKKRLFDGLVEVFRAHQIPIEVIGLGGLLRMPEVIDLVGVLRVLNDPMRNVALARLLRGPRWRIGHRDLAMISRHAAGRNRDLRQQLADAETPGDVAFSLAEALGSLDDVEGLSDTARARLQAFHADLAALRAEIAALPLQDVVARALDWLGLPAELDASPSPAAPAIKRNLANFLDRVAAFEPLDGEPTLGALIEWLDAIDESDEQIEASEPSADDSVKLMTIHQAKGLEFDIVFLPGLATGRGTKIFPDTARQPNPMQSPQYLPFTLRGDRDVLPDWDNNLAGFRRELEARAMEEERRLLYVAVTRARHRLVASAAHWYEPSTRNDSLKNPMGPSAFWHEIAEFPGVQMLERVDEAPEPNPLIGRRAERAHAWPLPARPEPDALFPDGLAATVRARREMLGEDPTLFPAPEPKTGPPSPTSLPVSALVTFGQCPKRFYWSYVRPLPRRSSSAARVGTIVHAWIEQLGRGQITLYDPEEFEERAPSAHGARIAELKEAFKGSRFAGRTPVAAERGFSLLIGEVGVHGRIDAIFERDDGGWEIVDFKTGRAPEAEGSEILQLELYALAAQEIWDKAPEDLTLTFAYIGSSEERTYQARAAAEIRKEIEAALDAIAARAFEPQTSPLCRSCDFLRDCREGQDFVASMS